MTADLTEIIERTQREHQPRSVVGPTYVVCACDERMRFTHAHTQHVAEAVTAAITEHTEVEEQWGVRYGGSYPVPDARFPMPSERHARELAAEEPVTYAVSRTTIAFPWKDVTTDADT